MFTRSILTWTKNAGRPMTDLITIQLKLDRPKALELWTHLLAMVGHDETWIEHADDVAFQTQRQIKVDDDD